MRFKRGCRSSSRLFGHSAAGRQGQYGVSYRTSIAASWQAAHQQEGNSSRLRRAGGRGGHLTCGPEVRQGVWRVHSWRQIEQQVAGENRRPNKMSAEAKTRCKEVGGLTQATRPAGGLLGCM